MNAKKELRTDEAFRSLRSVDEFLGIEGATLDNESFDRLLGDKTPDYRRFIRDQFMTELFAKPK